MKNRTTILAALCAAALAAGCGKKAESRREYAPLLPQGVFAMAFTDASRISDGAMGQFLLSEQKRSLAAMKEAAREYPELAKPGGPFSSTDWAEVFLAREASLGSKARWVVLAVEKPAVKASDFRREGFCLPFPAMTVVEYAKEDVALGEVFEKVSGLVGGMLGSGPLANSACAGLLDGLANAFAVADGEVAGCAVKKLSIVDKDIAKRVADFEPCLGVYDGRLVIAASSPKAFAGAVALYKGEAPAAGPGSPAAQELRLGGDAASRFSIYGVSDFIKEFMEGRPLPGDEEAVKYAESLRQAGVCYMLDDAAMAGSLAFGATFADPSLASSLATTLNEIKGIGGMFVAMAAAADPSLGFLNDFYAGTKIGAKDGTCAIEMPFSKETLSKVDYKALYAFQAQALLRASAAADEMEDGDDMDSDASEGFGEDDEEEDPSEGD